MWPVITTLIGCLVSWTAPSQEGLLRKIFKWVPHPLKPMHSPQNGALPKGSSVCVCVLKTWIFSKTELSVVLICTSTSYATFKHTLVFNYHRQCVSQLVLAMGNKLCFVYRKNLCFCLLALFANCCFSWLTHFDLHMMLLLYSAQML